MKLPLLLSITGLAFMVACAPVEPPKTPAERHARLYAAAEKSFNACGQFMMGGFSSAQDLKKVRDQQYALAKKYGATDAHFTEAAKVVENGFSTQEIFTNRQQACNALLTEIARHS